MLLATIAVAISLRFLPQASLGAATPAAARAGRLTSQQLPADIAALVEQLREAETQLQVLERDGEPGALETKLQLEQSVRMGVAALREAGMSDDHIFMSVMAPKGVSAAPPPPSAAAAVQGGPVAQDPFSDRPISEGVTHGLILIRDKDGSITPFALIHGLRITAPSTGEGSAACVCVLNAPESHKPGTFCIQASVESLRQMTQAMFVHVEESAVLGMLHDATDGAYGEAAEAPPAINLPSYFTKS